MSKINWTQVVVFGVVALLVFIIGVNLVSPAWGGSWEPWGRQGSGQMMGPGMMGGWGFGPLAWLFMALWFLFPLGLLVLLVLGIVWLFQQVSSPARPAAGSPQAPAGQPCPNCGRPAQADWHVCPYCGQALT